MSGPSHKQMVTVIHSSLLMPACTELMCSNPMAYQRCLIRAGEDLVMGNVQVYKHLASLDDAPFHIQMNSPLVQNGCALTSHFEPLRQKLR